MDNRLLNISLAILALGAYAFVVGCTPAQETQTQTAVTTACALSLTLDASASAQVKADIAAACADEAAVAPVIGAAVTK